MSSVRSSTDSPAPGTPAVGFTTSGKPACSATAVSSSTDPANQNGTVGRPSSSAASLRMPSRSRPIRTLRGVGYTSRPRSAAATSASTAITPDSATTTRGLASSMIAVSASASFILTTDARSETPCAGASAYRSTATTFCTQPLERQGQFTAQLSGTEQHHHAWFFAALDRLGDGRFDGRHVLGIRGLGRFTHRPPSLPAVVRTRRGGYEMHAWHR